MTSSIPEGLQAYLKAQAEARRHQAEEMYGRLTERERLLVKEAATMGWVRGALAAGGGRENIPMGDVILETVLLACQGFADLYPTIAALDGIDRSGDDDDSDEAQEAP